MTFSLQQSNLAGFGPVWGGSARGYLVRSSTTTVDHSGTEWLGKGAGFQSSVINCLLEYLKGNKQREDQLTEIARTFTSHHIPSFLRKRIFMSTHPGSAITLPTLHIPAWNQSKNTHGSKSLQISLSGTHCLFTQRECETETELLFWTGYLSRASCHPVSVTAVSSSHMFSLTSVEAWPAERIDVSQISLLVHAHVSIVN